MEKAIKVRKNWKRKIPGVVHVDGTARVQTVNQKQKTLDKEKSLFLYSIFYLFALFVLLLIEYFTKFFFAKYSSLIEGLSWF